MTQRLNLAETIDQRIDTQPLHVIFASYNMWVGFERIILRFQRRIPLTAGWPLSFSLRGQIASLLPRSVDQSSHKSDQIQEKGDMDPTKREISRSLGFMF